MAAYAAGARHGLEKASAPRRRSISRTKAYRLGPGRTSPHTAVPQAYYNYKQGIRHLT